MYKYINNNQLFEFAEKLKSSDGYLLSENLDDLEDQATHFVLVDDNFELPTIQAKAEDIYSGLTNQEIREIEYEKRIPRNLLDKYITYTAEGNIEAANDYAQQIAAVKEQIRSEYPD